MTRYIDYDALTAATLETDPYDHGVVPGWIPADPLRAINESYPDISHAGNESLSSLSASGAFAEFVEEIQGPRFAESLGNLFDLDLSRSPSRITVRRFAESSDGHIHTDHRSKTITVLFYFNEEWGETAGNLRLLRADTDIEDYTVEVPPYGGTMLAFRRTDHSFHGHLPFVGERRTLQLNFLRAGPVSLLHQGFDRMSTRVMKGTLRLLNRS